MEFDEAETDVGRPDVGRPDVQNQVVYKAVAGRLERHVIQKSDQQFHLTAHYNRFLFYCFISLTQ